MMDVNKIEISMIKLTQIKYYETNLIKVINIKSYLIFFYVNPNSNVKKSNVESKNNLNLSSHFSVQLASIYSKI